MSEQLHAIEKELEAREAQLYDASVEYKSLAYDAALKRATYDVDYANSILEISSKADSEGVKMTVIEKENLAVKSVQNQLKECRIAEAMADGSKRHLVTLQSIISSIQTRASLLKTESRLNSVYP